MSNPPSWSELGTRALRVAKIKARETQQAVQGVATSARNTVQANPKVAGAIKTAGTVGKVAKVAVPVAGAVFDFATGLAEGEDPIRAAVGSGGSLGGGAAGLYTGAGIGTAIFPGVGTAIGGGLGFVGGTILGGWGADRVDEAVRGKQPIDRQREQQAQQQTGVAPTGSSTSTPSYKPINGAYQVNPNATYRYQPMRPDGSGGVVTQSSGMPAPLPATQRQPQRGGVQPATFIQGGNGRPNTVQANEMSYLQGFEPGGKFNPGSGNFSESAAAGAPQTPAPSNNGQLVQAGFNPLPAIAKGIGKAAPKVTAATSGGSGVVATIGGAVGPKAWVEELAKYGLILPTLIGTGLIGPKPAAPPPAGGANAPGSMGPNALPSQPHPLDQLLTGGWFNRTFGNPGGLNYQKNQMQNATQNRALDIKDRNENRKIDADVYDTDTRATTERRGQDLRIQGIDMTLQSNERRTNTQYGPGGSVDRGYKSKERQVTQTNQTRLQQTAMQHGVGGSVDRTNKTRFGIANLQHGKGGSIDRTNTNKKEIATMQYGVGGSADRVAKERSRGNLEVTKEKNKGNLGVTKEKNKGNLEVTKEKNKGTAYVADQRLMGVKYSTDGRLAGTMYTADQKVNQEGVRQSGAANVADIKAGATMGAAKTAADAKVNVARIGLEGTQYKADATVKVASITSQAKAEAEGGKAISSYMSNLNKAAADSMEKEERSRIARYKALGVY
ncbi:MAG: hypothetical protein KME27_31420 [Lyngbya sp. HA4199-MV5]|jgi:hypothetical protein|nr:hypothetical protein [Lyngbya sp. HA4199-MV5]